MLFLDIGRKLEFPRDINLYHILTFHVRLTKLKPKYGLIRLVLVYMFDIRHNVGSGRGFAYFTKKELYEILF